MVLPTVIADPERAPRRRRRRVIDSVAVLPLANHSDDPELEYFSDGLTETLINNLSQIPRLRVMARSTVFRYKERHADPQAVGRHLDVQAVVTGHVVQRAGTCSVAAELVDVADGSRLWGTVLNRRAEDVAVLQVEIAAELTTALRLRLSRDERKRLGKRHTVNAEAYQLYLRGRYFLNIRTGDALKTARTLFERAVAEDPDYALAHAGLADCCALIAVSLRGASGTGLIEQARAAAQTSAAARRRAGGGPRVAGLHQVPVRLGLGRRRGRVHAGARAQSRPRAVAAVVRDVPRVALALRRGARAR